MRHLPKVAGLVLVLLSFWFVGRVFVASLDDLRSMDWLLVTSAVGLSAVLYVIGAAFGSVAWVILLGARPTLRGCLPAMLAFFVSQIGKYVPGNIAHHVGRVVLTRGLGFSLAAITSALFIETAWVLGAGLIVGSGFLAEAARSRGWTGLDPFLVILVSAAGIFVCVPVLMGYLRRTQAPLVRRLGWPSRLVLPATGRLISAAVLLLVPFLLVGLALMWTLDALGHESALSLWGLSGAFAAAWILGFLVPGASAGLGVREAVLVALLSPALEPHVALELALVLRLATTVGDVALFGVGSLGRTLLPK